MGRKAIREGTRSARGFQSLCSTWSEPDLAYLVGGTAGVGAGAGAAVGLATALLTRGKDVELRQGATMDVAFDHPIDLQ